MTTKSQRLKQYVREALTLRHRCAAEPFLRMPAVQRGRSTCMAKVLFAFACAETYFLWYLQSIHAISLMDVDCTFAGHVKAGARTLSQ